MLLHALRPDSDECEWQARKLAGQVILAAPPMLQQEIDLRDAAATTRGAGWQKYAVKQARSLEAFSWRVSYVSGVVTWGSIAGLWLPGIVARAGRGLRARWGSRWSCVG
jgi:hypothetical protein